MPRVTKFKRGEVWYLNYTLESGRKKPSTGIRDEVLAENERAEVEARLNREKIYGEEKGKEITFAECYIVYCDDYPDRTLDIRWLMKINKVLGETKIKDINSKVLQRLANRFYPDGAETTKNRAVLSPAQKAINNMLESIHGNKTQNLRIERFPEPDGPTLDKAPTKEWLEAYRAVTDPHDGALAKFMFETGARISESIHPKLKLDLPNRRATLDGKYVKNRKTRTFYLSEEMAVELMELPKKDGTIFGYKDRFRPLKVRKKVCKEHGLPYFSLHGGGRHGFATEMLVRNGVDIATVQKMGNWKSPKVLLKNYAHPEGVDDIVDQVFSSQSGNSKISTLKKAKKDQ